MPATMNYFITCVKGIIPHLYGLLAHLERTTDFSEEVLDRALALLLAQEEWLAENRDEITACIEVGYEEAGRGELIDGDEVRSRMAARKNEWMAAKRTLRVATLLCRACSR